MAGAVRTTYRVFTGKSRVHIDWRKSFKKLAPTGVAAGIDIGFSNWGLELVTISLFVLKFNCISNRLKLAWPFLELDFIVFVIGFFLLFSLCSYTMTKSSTIIFILFFAILFGLEKKVHFNNMIDIWTTTNFHTFFIRLFSLQSWMLMVIVVLISMGLCMFTYKSTQFNMLGFIFLILASITSAIRWTFAQFIMQKSKLGLHNPIDMIYFMQPWMILPLLPLTLGFEGKFHFHSCFLSSPLCLSINLIFQMFTRPSIMGISGLS